MTRGPEQGRDPQTIFDEAQVLADQGCKEITLLGQTVNSYRHVDPAGTTTKLADLLYRLHDIDGIERIKFVTNYPKDMDYELLTANSRPDQGLSLPSRAAAKRIGRGAETDEARLHGCRLSRDDEPD